MTAGWCLLAAVASMLLYGGASVAQAAGARRADGPRVLVQPVYVAGLVADAAAWALSVVALVALPLVVVQPLLAGSVAVAVAVLGLVLVALASGPEGATAAPTGLRVVLLAACAACTAATAGLYRRGPAPAVAVVAGLSFAGAAVAGRAVVAGADLLDAAVLQRLVSDPLAWAVVGFGVLGTVGYARALERGGLGMATAVMWVVEAVVPAVVGVLLLGDAVRPGWAWTAAVGGALAVAGCVVLALSPTQAALGE